MSLITKDDEVWYRYDESWYVIKDKRGIEFHISYRTSL